MEARERTADLHRRIVAAAARRGRDEAWLAFTVWIRLNTLVCTGHDDTGLPIVMSIDDFERGYVNARV